MQVKDYPKDHYPQRKQFIKEFLVIIKDKSE